MKVYSGEKTIKTITEDRHIIDTRTPLFLAYVDGVPLDSKIVTPRSRTKFRAFAWGYPGFLPKNLAVSILADCLDIVDVNDFRYSLEAAYVLNKFYYEYVCRETSNKWVITEDVLLEYIDKRADEYASMDWSKQ